MAASRFQHNKLSGNFRTAVRSVPPQSHTRSVAPPAGFISLNTTTTINSVIYRQPAVVGFVQERTTFPRELVVLEPRPLVYWSSVEDRIGCL